MNKKTDLRIIRTKKSIKKAFFDLLKKKNYNKITIQNIAEGAVINRNTFYLHYLDKDDLLDQLSNECLNKLKGSMKSSNNIDTINDLGYDDFYELNKKVFETIQEDFDFYKVILGDESIPYLSIKFTNIIKNHMNEGLDKSVSVKENRDVDNRIIYIEYMAAGLIGVIRFWINNRNKYSIEEVSKIVVNMYSEDILELLKRS
ncbi:MAG: TetR/AcrR family transcriptional regulator [Tepidibacter sp.]|jgi:AcrR family transcriptional regulator|uniref:TetR/AcrR family transcriptional regulator n=1 Tax=Tepidibacter sp. TaxID=2529387 RepID=UPI0025D148D5|nr:TetR/AcrR family transcriptional regulator [Tepidibacter sp.]MCT4509567.1 TetR/AcrR family transcriptional regulator [Tepidibacter sp.]